MAKQTFVKKSNIVHNKKYTYIKVDYKTAAQKIIITCPIHGDFECSPNNHLRGKGCPKCGIEKSITAKIKPYEDYYNDFIKLYDNKYDYSSVIWKGSSFPISIICKQAWSI